MHLQIGQIVGKESQIAVVSVFEMCAHLCENANARQMRQPATEIDGERVERSKVPRWAT